MDKIHINKILKRETIAIQIKDLLKTFELNKDNLLLKRGIYIYGEPGTGKTEFINRILEECGYDIIKYDSGDVRNKAIIDTITKYNISDKSIISVFTGKIRKIAIVMDEIDGMNNGDKGGINTLIKLIRPKKTKKQKLEDTTINPVICIGNYHVDKKIKDLMKVCSVFELEPINKSQTNEIIQHIMPSLHEVLKERIYLYCQSDLRKLKTIYSIYSKIPDSITLEFLDSILHIKTYGDDTKKITKNILNGNIAMDQHLTIMNETDRTVIGLLWHENVVDILEPLKKKETIPVYLTLLESMSFADYIDRITFQKQIWQFNEMSSLLKTFKTNSILHENIKKIKSLPNEIRFTKVLTKYSTEYNNTTFIQTLCQKLGLCKSDLFLFFLQLKNEKSLCTITELLENEELSKLDVNRMFKYLDNHIADVIIDAEDQDDSESIS